MKKTKHNWIPLCSDINSTPSETYHWWRCANCKKETNHIKNSQPKPSSNGCKGKKRGNVFPLSSI